MVFLKIVLDTFIIKQLITLTIDSYDYRVCYSYEVPIEYEYIKCEY